MGEHNEIHPSARIDCHLEMGSYNHIGPNVTVIPLDKRSPGTLTLGDCNVIHEDVKLIVGADGIWLGDWNVLHNHVFAIGEVALGHNCWIGQGTHLDGRGGLTLGDGVAVSMGGFIWTHVALGARLSGCELYGFKPTILEDEVWLVGNAVHIDPGVRVARRSIILSHAVVTKDTDPECTYAGVPAKKLAHSFWREVSRQEKHAMMLRWIKEYVDKNRHARPLHCEVWDEWIKLATGDGEERLSFGFSIPEHQRPLTSYFDMETMRYTKRLTELERGFYGFLCGSKAKFVPMEGP